MLAAAVETSVPYLQDRLANADAWTRAPLPPLPPRRLPQPLALVVALALAIAWPKHRQTFEQASKNEIALHAPNG